jgi:hypothetical protein
MYFTSLNVSRQLTSGTLVAPNLDMKEFFRSLLAMFFLIGLAFTQSSCGDEPIEKPADTSQCTQVSLGSQYQVITDYDSSFCRQERVIERSRLVCPNGFTEETASSKIQRGCLGGSTSW